MTLTILIWVPLALSLVAALLPAKLAGRAAVVWSAITLGLAISFLARFKTGGGGLQFVTDKVWISALGIHYKLGLDGLNVALVMTTTIIFSAALLWASTHEWERSRVFYFHFGLAESAVLGAFCAQDLALFVAFFDLMLIPFYFLSGIWGGPDRVRATTRLVIYTLVGSFFMLVAAIATGVLASSQHGTPLTFVLSSLRGLPLSHTTQTWVFLAFAVAFLVKMPLVPFHGWLPDGYKAMPIPAVAVFSAILSKVAAYGFLRIVLPLFPYAAAHFQTLMLIIAVVSILWATLVAMTTPDARLVVAYSSVAQLGFIMLGVFSLRPEGDQGALLQMVNHALVTAPLFFIVAALAVRAGGSEKLADMGGIAFRAPMLAALFLIATLGLAGDARVLELRRGVHDPAGRVQHQAADRAGGLARRRRRGGLRAARVHHHHAQPGGPARELVRHLDRRRAADHRPAGGDPRARLLSAVRAAAVAVRGERGRRPGAGPAGPDVGQPRQVAQVP